MYYIYDPHINVLLIVYTFVYINISKTLRHSNCLEQHEPYMS